VSEKKIRVLVVDDSALARRAITDALSHDPELQVVGGAVDPYQAREKIVELEPDVITLDLEMPRMDGLTFLKILMEHHPIPVVVVSSLTQAGSAKAMEALALGAVDVLGKPDGSRTLGELADQLAYHVKAAARSKRKKDQEALKIPAEEKVVLPAYEGGYSMRQIILIGSSTGGVEAVSAPPPPATPTALSCSSPLESSGSSSPGSPVGSSSPFARKTSSSKSPEPPPYFPAKLFFATELLTGTLKLTRVLPDLPSSPLLLILQLSSLLVISHVLTRSSSLTFARILPCLVWRHSNSSSATFGQRDRR